MPMPTPVSVAPATLKYNVATLRSVGLEARWGRNSRGAPIILARNPQATLAHQRNTWWSIDARMFAEMQRVGVIEAFDNYTLLADVFSIPA